MYRNLFAACVLSTALLVPTLADANGARLLRDRAYELSLKGQNAGTPAATIRATVNYAATTVGGPSWTRPFADCTGATGLGPMTYHVQPFFVDATGAHDVTSVQTAFDGYLFVYQGTFDPLAPNTNCVIGNDDAVSGIGASEILGVNLTAGVQYIVVTTGFENGEEGAFTNTITGPGNITLGVVASADLGIVKTAPGGVAVGGNYTYELTASNAGTLDATGVVVTDVLPAGVNFVSSTCGAVNTAGTITWAIGAMANGATANCTLTVALAGAMCVAVSNTATIDGAEADGNAANNSSTASNGGGAGGNVVADPSFEAYTPSAAWTEASTNFGTPLCNAVDCGGTGNGTGPRTGAVWAWFGGIALPETGSMEQTVTIPTGATAITFWRELPVCANATDFVRLLVDGVEVWRADGTNPACNTLGYAQISIPLTGAQANGAAHLVRFESTISGAPSGSNFFIDDVEILGPASPPVCTAGGAGVVGVLSAAVSFGPQTVGSNTQRVLTITNTGTAALQVTGISAVNAPFAQIAGGTCGATPFSIAAGANCTVFYTFVPTSAGDFSQVVTVTADVGTATATLSGRGVAVIALPILNSFSTLLLLVLLTLGSLVALRRHS